MIHRRASFLSAALVAGASLSVGAGCARTATFAVTRPAMLNAAAVGNTMQVRPVQAATGMPMDFQAAAEITADLQGRITNSLNPSIRLVASNGGVVITGTLINNVYGEEIQRSEGTCTRSVPYYAQGRTQYRVETYACTNLTRIGTAQATIQFQVLHGTSGEAIFDQTYQDTARNTTTGRISAYERAEPPPIDGLGMLHAVRANLTDQFARVILPWRENVTVEFEDCDGEARCRQGFEMVQHGNLSGAEPLFTAVIGQFSNPGVPVPPGQAERIGEAFYNRGITRSYMGNYARAVADLTRAIQLRPDESDWQQELQNAQRMARDQESLRQQGAVQNETQNVQQAGTP